MHQWNDEMNDEMNEAAALADATAMTLNLLPASDSLTADERRDLAHALHYLSDHFKVVSQKPSLLPDNLARYRALHAAGLG